MFYCSDEFAESPDLTVLFVSYNRNLVYTSIMEGVTSKAFSRITLIKLADLGLYVMLAVRQVTLAGEVTLAYSACLSCLFASKARPDRCRGNWHIIRWFWGSAACQFSYFEYLFPHYRTSLHLADYLLRILALLGMLCVIMQRDAGYRWRRTRLRAQFRLSLVQCWDYTHIRLPQLG